MWVGWLKPTILKLRKLNFDRLSNRQFSMPCTNFGHFCNQEGGGGVKYPPILIYKYAPACTSSYIYIYIYILVSVFKFPLNTSLVHLYIWLLIDQVCVEWWMNSRGERLLCSWSRVTIPFPICLLIYGGDTKIKKVKKNLKPQKSAKWIGFLPARRRSGDLKRIRKSAIW